MKKKSYIIADFGASNGRIIVGTFDGQKIEMEIIHRFENYPIKDGDTLCWDISRLYSELKKGIGLALKNYECKSIAIDTWGIDFGLIDKKGELLSNPISYRDKSKSSKIFKKVFEEIPREEIFNITGWNPDFTIAPLYYLFYLKLKKPQVLRDTSKFLMMPDIFNWFLTGKYFTEYSIASNSLLVNSITKSWEEKLYSLSGLKRDIFPKIVLSGKAIGQVKKEVCAELGTNPIKVVTAASHDTASSVVGIPSVNSKKSWAFLSAGTWIVLGTETKKQIIEEEVLKYGFTNEGGALGGNFFAKNMTGLWILQQCRNNWIQKNDLSWEEIVRKAKNSKPFKAFIDIDNPIFAQSQIDMPKVITRFCKNSGQNIPDTIGEISRCLFESMVLSIKYYLNILSKLTRKNIENINIVGGGVNNKLLCQFIANATRVKVLAGPIEATSIGNLIMQLKADGEIDSLEEGRMAAAASSEIIMYEPIGKNRWEEAYSRFLNLFK